MNRFLRATVLVFLGSGCSSAVPVTDAGVSIDIVDAGHAADGGERPDAAIPDAAIPDAAIPDAAIPDAAIPDAGTSSCPSGAPNESDPPPCPQSWPVRFEFRGALDSFTGSVMDLDRLPLPRMSRHFQSSVPMSVVSPGRRGASSKALRCEYGLDATCRNQTCGWQTEPTNQLLGGYDPTAGALLLEFFFRIEPGYDMGGVGIKWFELWRPDGTARSQLGLLFGDWSWNPNSRGNWGTPFRTMDRPISPNRRAWIDVNDGAWHRYTLLVRPNTREGTMGSGWEVGDGQPSSRDGLVKLWVDGVKQVHIEQAVVGVTPPGGSRPWTNQAGVDAISDDGVARLELPSLFNCSQRAGWVEVEPPMVWQQPR
ncbi:MAG: hypothetical protein SFW67_10880 [Myxococcaceae bacterium]|nr:hypothetical protein [Myxococcaceae bacterium]